MSITGRFWTNSPVSRFCNSYGKSYQWQSVAIGLVLILNLIALLAYQHYLAGDFPFQDEWGYVNRLQDLPANGFFHYLFDRYQTYFIPVFLFIWYLFYALTHLDIMTIRYTGAAISALVSLLLCVMLYRKKGTVNLPILLLILCGPFIICSYNHWASYNQSIESVAEPLLFGMVLVTCWIADKTLRPERGLVWSSLCIVGWLVASGIYAPALALLPAIVAARFFLLRRIDPSLLLMGSAALVLLAFYIIAGHGLNSGNGHHGGTYLIESSAFKPGDLLKLGGDWLGLTGNTLFTPAMAAGRNFTRFLGLSILLLQAFAVFHVMRLPAEQRRRFMIPLTLTFYNFLVFVEIAIGRFHYPNMAFTPRYSIHMLGGPVSLLFWGVMLTGSTRWKGWLRLGTIALIVLGVAVADGQTFARLKYVRNYVAAVRMTLLSLKAEPNHSQQAAMQITDALLPLVYSDKLFLENNHLALYRNGSSDISSTLQANSEPLTIVEFGPKRINAGTGFNIQKNGESALWLRMSRETSGVVYVVINGMKLQAHHRGNLVTAGVPEALYSKPGSYSMFVLDLDGSQQVKSDSVTFAVN